VRYGFVIDQRRCIGCHACTVACKEENQVPLGASRTWVKYVERGAFPHTRRYFAVLRCNHCDEAPCVTICPTVALYRRSDGIVDFDGTRCIGCKSCMQACPYDALYMDPGTGTAAKCHYCAHRTEIGLEPACVVVCPEQAIIAGDLDDATSRIARLVATEQVQVRKAEQGTRPKVFYVGADTAALTPTLQTATNHYMFAQRPAEELSLVSMVAAHQRAEGPGDAAQARTVYDVPHLPQPWGWKVSTYLWTKSIAAGAFLVGVPVAADPGATLVAALISLVFLALTGALLIADLKRPDRFHYLLLKPNWRSWLVWGAWILIAFGAVVSIGALTSLAGKVIAGPLGIAAVVLALATAGYSAFLFGQAEGRDFWQSPLKLVHLIVASVAAGGAVLLLADPGWERPPSSVTSEGGVTTIIDFAGAQAGLLVPLLVFALVAHACLVMAELLSRHASRDAALAAWLLRRGPLSVRLWGGVVVAGVLTPIAAALGAAAWESASLTVVAAVLALGGLWLYEDLWIRAGQSVPLS
jgi:Fe-S-cluster-containing dehydrogenase component/formate-dependent nitrite reductase membrane component NrfD